MIRIVVGSKAKQKIEAVAAAVMSLGIDADVVGISTRSGVPEQPVGGPQTMSGAYSRACQAANDPGPSIAIGIENGLEGGPESFLDVAIVVVIAWGNAGIFVRSEPVPVPEELVHQVLASRQEVTAGSLEARRSGCDPADPHKVWSGGKTDRTTILTDAVRRALSLAIAAQGATS